MRDERPKNGMDDCDSETLEITEEDAAFILGKGGKTKAKIARVSGCQIELLEEDMMLEFMGTAAQRRRAMRYVKCVMAQRVGAVSVTEEDVADECTVLEVPQEAVGFVTGKGGNFLRTLEEEHGTLMFFADQENAEQHEEFNDLMIFGPRVSRRGAQLSVMGVVETKIPGHYTEAFREKGTTYENKADMVGDWGTRTLKLADQKEISYAIGSQGKTRKKLGKSSECIVQYIGNIVFLSGTKKQRDHAYEYLKMLLDQLEGPISIDTKGRDDATVLEVPVDCVGYVTGRSRETLSTVEETTGTLTFFMENKDKDPEAERLVIFGAERARRGAELMIMSAVERKQAGHYTSKMRDKKTNTRGFDTDCLTMDGQDMAYALGREGATRKKLGLASHAILQFVGTMAFIAGDGKERQRCRDYLGLLLEQKDGKINTEMLAGRSDVTEVELREDAVHWLLSKTGLPEMRRVEEESETFAVMADMPDGEVKLLVCGHEEGSAYSDKGRVKAARILKKIAESPHNREKGGGKGDSWREGGKGKGGSRRERSRSRGRERDGGGWRGGRHHQEQQWPAPRQDRGTRSWTSSSSRQEEWWPEEETWPVRSGGTAVRRYSSGSAPAARAAHPAARQPAKRDRSPTPPWRTKAPSSRNIRSEVYSRW